MPKSNPCLSRALRRALYSTVTIPTIFGATQALAQDDDVIEELIVTGSRIARDPNVGATVPVQSVGEEDIQMSGKADLGEILNDMPALLGSNTSSNSVSGIFGTGSGETAGSSEVGETILQLRALGVERTLVLVNGRRHVSGVAGTQAVDIGSIPQELIQRVDVLTGGASAIYGADAVTGVVNFVMKDNYEGFNVNVKGGMSSEGDSEDYQISALYGTNFANDRGNFTVAASYTDRSLLQMRDRSWANNNGIANDDQNPMRRFQTGDIDAANTPNFARFYSPTTSFPSTDAPCDLFGFDYCYGFHPTGFPILDQASFANLWGQAFPGDPLNLTQAEMDLISRAQTAPSRAILPEHNFSLTSPGGVLVPGGLFQAGVDLDNNGTEDCSQSYQGFYSTYDFSPPALGFIGGCWIIEPDGSVRPLQDGLIAGDINQFGPDGVPDWNNADELLPKDEKVMLNLTANYDFTDTTTGFFEGKFVRQKTVSTNPGNTFWDLLTIAPDNPYISQLPPALAAVGQAEGFYLTRDPDDLGPNNDQSIRETFRVVAGLEGELDNGWGWEVAANFGRFEQEFQDRNRVIVDRWLASVDAVDDGNGNVICRSDIDPTPPPSTPFDIPLWVPSFHTFNPGDGQCAPANVLGGVGAISQQAIDFVTQNVINNFESEQFVLSAIMTGDMGDFGFSAGAIGFAFGLEYRDESSESKFDPLVLGVQPVTTAFGNQGQLLSEIYAGQDNTQRSMVFDSESLIQNIQGSYDVIDVFGEVSVPLLADLAFAQELTLDAAVRLSDYSTVGQTTTWNAGGSWTPVSDSLRFRASYSVSVRAPNVNELFSPAQAAFFRPVDPCDSAEIAALQAAGDPVAPIRAANCAAAGISPTFTDPLTARFVGETRGNPDLSEEEAESISFGAIFTPTFLEGLTVSVDYWDISIEDAIDSPSDQDIVDGCYDSVDYPNNQFCLLHRRNDDPGSPQFNGLEFISQQQLNIGKLDAAGVDFSARYAFDIGASSWQVGVSGTWMDKLNRFFDPLNPEAVDPELGELQRPEWAGNFDVSAIFGNILVQYNMQFMDEQALRSVEIETAATLYGPAGIADATQIHNISAAWDINDSYTVYGGINNITDESPFITELAFPVNPQGQFMFLGLEMNFL